MTFGTRFHELNHIIYCKNLVLLDADNLVTFCMVISIRLCT